MCVKLTRSGAGGAKFSFDLIRSLLTCEPRSTPVGDYPEWLIEVGIPTHHGWHLSRARILSCVQSRKLVEQMYLLRPAS